MNGGMEGGREGGRKEGPVLCMQQALNYVTDKEKNSLKSKKYLQVASVIRQFYFPSTF